MKILPSIFVLLMLVSCSYHEPAITENATATKTPETAGALTVSPQPVTPSTEASHTPTPSPTPFERKNAMDSPKIVILKSERLLYLYDSDTLCAKINIALGFTPEGHKQKEGDGKTPEGTYYICTRNDSSRFYLSLGLSYPNIEDAEKGLNEGLIPQSEYEEIKEAIEEGARPPWSTALGGEIMIHGSGTSSDWTAGCVATDNKDMDYLWQNCPLGTPVEILP